MSFGIDVPFASHLGLELRFASGGESEVGFSPKDVHLNTTGSVHGGVQMTMLDVSMAMAAHSSAEPGRSVVTIEMKTSFMRRAVGPLTGRGTVRLKTGSLAFVEAQIMDAEGATCAMASGTFRYVASQVLRTPILDQG